MTMHSANCSSQSPKIECDRRGLCGYLFFVRNHRISESNPTYIIRALMHACKGGTESPWADKRRCVPMYPTAVSYGCEDALASEACLTGGRAVLLKGIESGIYPESCIRREMYDCLAAGAMGAGPSSGHMDSGKINLDMYQLDQWRLMHIGAQPVPPSLIKHWLDYFPNHQYDTNYGLSESLGPGCVHLGIGEYR